MNSLALAIFLAASGAATPTLDSQDEGLYMLVHQDGHLIRDHIDKLQLDGTQWNIYNRLPDGTWKSVTCEKACLLTPSTPQEIRAFTSGTSLSGASLACVHDTAFAFCRETRTDSSRSYYLVAFVNGMSVPIKYVRLNADTLEPSGAP